MRRFALSLFLGTFCVSFAACQTAADLPHGIAVEHRFLGVEREAIAEVLTETNEVFIRPCLGFDGLIPEGIIEDDDGFTYGGDDYGDGRHVIYKVPEGDPTDLYISELYDEDLGGYGTLADVIMVQNLDHVPEIDAEIASIREDPNFPADPELVRRVDGLEAEKDHLIQAFKMVLRHELGHHLGLTHSPIEEALMYAGYKDPARTFTSFDKEAFAFVHGCSYE